MYMYIPAHEACNCNYYHFCVGGISILKSRMEKMIYSLFRLSVPRKKHPKTQQKKEQLKSLVVRNTKS